MTTEMNEAVRMQYAHRKPLKFVGIPQNLGTKSGWYSKKYGVHIWCATCGCICLLDKSGGEKTISYNLCKAHGGQKVKPE